MYGLANKFLLFLGGWSIIQGIAPVAQLDRVLPSEGKGREFESRQARQFRFFVIFLRDENARSEFGES